jgi:hypothetical protein
MVEPFWREYHSVAISRLSEEYDGSPADSASPERS